MSKRTRSNWKTRVMFTTIAAAMLIFAAALPAMTQDWNQNYEAGDRVEIKRAEGWFKAVIIEVGKNGFYTIKYDVDGFTGYAQKDVMRPLGGPKQPKKTEANGTARDGSRGFLVGDKVEVDSRGSWLPAEILAVKGDAYRIHYSGYGQASDEWMSPTRMRYPDEPRQARQETGKPARTQADALNDQERGVDKYKPGDRVECDKAGIDSWEKGTVMPFRKNDRIDGKTFRVRLDSFARSGMYLDGHECLTENIRPIGAPAYKNDKTAVPVGNVTVDDENTLSADRPILECPAKQTAVKNGAPPNLELFKKIIRCKKGEKPATRGRDGAVTLDVTAIQAGTPRPWIYGQDLGGKPGTIIHPVKATFHYKTFYRSSTEVSQNWIRILNFYVNAFGEWEIGSEVSVKAGETVNIPRDRK